ncbi:MAG: hypothetical protein ACM3SX_06290 [Deltaproteobacteria bacterium]
MDARFRVTLALGVVAFGAMVGGCATTVSNPWWYYHYDPSSGSTTMSNPWWYYHYDPYGYDYRYYGYPWPDYYHRYDPYYPYGRYDARPMVSPSPPAVFDHRASASDRERGAARLASHADPFGTKAREMTNDRAPDRFARAVDTNDGDGHSQRATQSIDSNRDRRASQPVVRVSLRLR